MGDAQKAIFFYKRYLSNSPKAKNRAEVDQKIEALQKQLSQQEQAKGVPPTGPFGPDNPNAAAAATEPPAAATTPPPATTASPVAPGTTPAASSNEPGAVVETGAVVATEPPPHRIDLRAAIGLNTWSSGLQENAQPSFAFTLSGGYTFGRPAAQIRFRMGALFGYTFLKEMDSKDTFTSFLIDPTILIRLAPKFQLLGDVGLGVLSIGGITANSALLDSMNVMVNGSQALFLFRIGAGVDYDLTPNVSLFFWPAISEAAKKEHFYQNIGRIELLAGVAYRP
jgi:hypothetical protein